MIKNNLKKKIMSAVVLGGVVTSLGITAFASDLEQTPVRQETNSQRQAGMMREGKGQGRGQGRMRQGQQDGQRNSEKNQERMSECLKESGAFSDGEIEEVKTYLEEKRAEMNEERANLRDKTPEERQAYFEENKDKRKNMIDELVNDGVITGEQAEKLQETMPQERQFRNR